MKGIILAGGLGSRLYPITKALSKHMLPIYDKPMIYYPLSILMQSNIREILIISTPRDIGSYKNLFGDGSWLGLSISYEIQQEPKGIADAFIIGEKFINGSSVALILGDNVFYGERLLKIIKRLPNPLSGATIFGFQVKDPREYGVVEFNNKGQAISIEEKPLSPKSHFAIPGLYFYDNQVVEFTKKLKPSSRGELEITDINVAYMNQGELKVEVLPSDVYWFDSGTFQGLLQACNFVEMLQKEKNVMISCIEEIAFRMGYINQDELMNLAKSFNNDYGKYIRNLEHAVDNSKRI